jgi:hypothetical protein
LNQSEWVGYLVTNGEQPNLDDLATELWMSENDLKEDLEKLIKHKLLRRDERGFVFDPMMKLDFEATCIRRGEGNGSQLVPVTGPQVGES